MFFTNNGTKCKGQTLAIQQYKNVSFSLFCYQGKTESTSCNTQNVEKVIHILKSIKVKACIITYIFCLHFIVQSKQCVVFYNKIKPFRNNLSSKIF